ncbi:hypothetical protein ACSBOB_26240 [Mesorhizobium sp. ASY16-5R]|uniref:hypothetical protein n=1 Tax=Mesorhizobium sp. ASY16-5R TaxID=3445772 RepID=UPI003FA06EE0
MATEPNPQLVSAATPSVATTSIISGETVQQCLAEQRFIKTVSVGEQGIYSPGLTYAFAERLQRVARDGAIYAPLVRAYEFRTAGTGYLGTKVDGSFACYFELKDGRLRYLATLQGGRDNRVNRHEFDRATLQAYTKMSGKSRAEVLFGG